MNAYIKLFVEKKVKEILSIETLKAVSYGINQNVFINGLGT
jgi:hypothetical protein